MSKQSKQEPKTTQKEAVTLQNEDKDTKSQLLNLSEKTQSFFKKYFLLLAVLISSVTLIGAILLAQSYLNPERNEAIYTEGTSEIRFREIDQAKLQTLEESLDNSNVNVEPDFVPNRSNPFSE